MALLLHCDFATTGGNVLDVSGNARHGIVDGGVWLTGPKRLRHDNTSDTVDFGVDFIPANEVTIILRYQKTDTTNRVSAAFGVLSGNDAERCGVHLPYSDGTVYFDFGGTGGAHRVAIGGLTFGDDVWAFTAGARGLEIWQNGVRVANNVNIPSRIPGSNNFKFGVTSFFVISDLADYKEFRVYSTQLTQAEIIALSQPLPPEPPPSSGGSGPCGDCIELLNLML